MVALPPNYKTAAQDMREASRGLILRLREERLAQKRSQQPRWMTLQPKDVAVRPDTPSDDLAPNMTFAGPDDPCAIQIAGSATGAVEPELSPSLTVVAIPAEASGPINDAGEWPTSLSRTMRSAPRNPKRDRITQAIAESCSAPVGLEADPQQANMSHSSADEPDPGHVEVGALETDAETSFVPALDDPVEFAELVVEPAVMSAPADAIGQRSLDGSDDRTLIDQRPRAEIPLEAMSSIGQGMRWRLAQLDIRSTNDLAAADADVLSSTLGEIGRLVNVSTWVEMAKSLVAA